MSIYTQGSLIATTDDADANDQSSPTRRGRGRPRKDASERKDQRVAFRLTDAEYEEAARRAGPQSVNAYAKKRLVNRTDGAAKIAVRTSDFLTTIIQQIQTELKKITVTDRNREMLAPTADLVEQLENAANHLNATLGRL